MSSPAGCLDAGGSVVCMLNLIDPWMDGCGWVGGWVDGWMDGWMD